MPYYENSKQAIARNTRGEYAAGKYENRFNENGWRKRFRWFTRKRNAPLLTQSRKTE